MDAGSNGTPAGRSKPGPEYSFIASDIKHMFSFKQHKSGESHPLTPQYHTEKQSLPHANR